MKKERTNRAVYARFAITVLVCAVLGGVAGYLAAMAGSNLIEKAAELNGVLAAPGLWWFAPGYVLLAVSTAYYFRGQVLLPRAEEDDDTFREADRRLCLSMILSGVSMVWMFIALGVGGQAMFTGAENLLLLLLLLVQLVWVVAVQAVAVKATKVIHPEKKGNVFDSRFQRDWYRSCDEAEQQQIGQCSYFSFRIMSFVFPIAMLVLFFLTSNGLAQPGWILLVGGLWMVQLMTYQCMAYHLDHGKKRR